MLVLLLITSWQPLAHASACGDRGGVVLQVLGSGGPESTDALASSGYLIWRDGKAVLLVDVGGGVPLRFEQAGARFEDLGAILFTHLHVDHSAGLPALVKAGFFTPRADDLLVLGPEGNALLPATDVFVERLFGPAGVYPYLADYLPTASDGATFRLRARAISPGEDMGRPIPLFEGAFATASVVRHGPLPALAWRVEIGGRVLVFTGDTSHAAGGLLPLAKGADILVAHNAVPQGAAPSALQLHMPPSEIGRVAAASEPGLVVLSHFMTRSRGALADTQTIIRRHYTGPLALAEDLACYVAGD